MYSYFMQDSTTAFTAKFSMTALQEVLVTHELNVGDYYLLVIFDFQRTMHLGANRTSMTNTYCVYTVLRYS